MALPAQLAPLAADPSSSAVVLDFDGTLAEIVDRPELAVPAPGAAAAVARLVDRFGLVAVVSGRPTAEVERLLGVPEVRYAGLYGLEEGAGPAQLPAGLAERVTAASAGIAGARVEDKGRAISVHYRQAPDPVGARTELLGALTTLAERAGLEVIEGKMVVELVPAGRARKGGAVRRFLHEFGSRAAMYAGDDLADLEAFEELARATAREGVRAVRVAVAGPETPAALVAAADLTVSGPSGLVGLLGELAAATA